MKKFYIYAFVVLALVAGTVVLGSNAIAAPDAKKPTPAAAANPDAWTVRCNKNDKAKDSDPKRGRCEIFQRLVVKESGKRFAEAAIGFPKDKKDARGIFVVPLGVLLQPGLQMKIDDGKMFKFQVRYCDGNGCFGYVDLNETLLDTMRKGTKLTLAFQAMNGKNINVEMSLKDFGKILQQVS